MVSAAVSAGDAEDPPGRAEPVDRLQLLDLAVALVTYGLTAIDLVWANGRLGATGVPPPIVHLLAAAYAVPVALRRRRPLLAWQLALVVLILGPTAFPRLFTDLPVILPAAGAAAALCCWTVASRHPPQVVVGVLAWSLGGLLLVANTGRPPASGDPLMFTWAVACLVLALVFGHNVRARRHAQADLAAQQERGDREEAARAVLEERSRIARELHDVVAHTMSVIAIQAEAAPLRAPDDAEALRGELAGIRALALQSLGELRRVLGVLRDDDGEADLAPAPDLDQLQALVEAVRAAGRDVELTVAGRPRPLSSGVAVTTYRVVQESLSNAVRHAPGAAVAVELTYRDVPPVLHVRVVNGPPQDRVAPQPGPRHGLVGMRERVAMLHGELIATPTTDGGYLVEVDIPLEDR
jgi:signal transduction histidine kinase